MLRFFKPSFIQSESEPRRQTRVAAFHSDPIDLTLVYWISRYKSCVRSVQSHWRGVWDYLASKQVVKRFDRKHLLKEPAYLASRALLHVRSPRAYFLPHPSPSDALHLPLFGPNFVPFNGWAQQQTNLLVRGKVQPHRVNLPHHNRP
jgi:hypothetical protein